MKLTKFVKKSYLDWDVYSKELDEMHLKQMVEAEARLNLESF